MDVEQTFNLRFVCEILLLLFDCRSATDDCAHIGLAPFFPLSSLFRIRDGLLAQRALVTALELRVRG